MEKKDLEELNTAYQHQLSLTKSEKEEFKRQLNEATSKKKQLQLDFNLADTRMELSQFHLDKANAEKEELPTPTR